MQNEYLNYFLADFLKAKRHYQADIFHWHYPLFKVTCGKTGKMLLFKKLGFTPCKAERPLQGMDYKKKNHKNIKAYKKSFYK